MERLTLNDQLSPSGKDFLLAALDPMHDNQLKDLSGWPDVETAASIVRCIKQSKTITCPSRITGNWDAYVVQLPFQNSLQFISATRSNNILNCGTYNSPPSTAPVIGGLSVWCVAAGAAVDYSANPDYVITFSDTYNKGAQRLLGLGFEFVNTTSDLNRQGQVAVWRQPNQFLDPTTATLYAVSASPTVSFTVAASTILISSPPKSFASAMLIPGTRQWKAADGCYVVVPHVGQDNPPLLPDVTLPVISTAETADTAYSWLSTCPTNSVNQLVPAPYLNVGSGYAVLPMMRTFPIHLCGAIFTGLSNTSTLTMTQNCYLETFPTTSEPDILVLATPSAEYDPVALQLYSHALTSLPVGVPAFENGIGDWFADVVSTVTDFLTPGALALGMPGLSALSAGAGRMAKGYMASQSPQEKQKSLGTPVNLSTKETRQLLQKAVNDSQRRNPNQKKKKKGNPNGNRDVTVRQGGGRGAARK